MFNRHSPRPKLRSRRRLILAAEFCIAGLLITQFFGVWQRHRGIDHEIAVLQAEAETLEQKNIELRELIGYLNSPAFIEEKARQDLGLQRPGEQVVILTEKAKANTPATRNDSASTESNPKKWLSFIFGGH